MPLQTKRKPFLTINNRIFQSPKNRIFFPGVNLSYWPKNAIFSLFSFDQIRLEIMLSDFEEKKDTFFGLKKKIFESPKNRIFSKGLTHTFGQNMPIIWFIYIWPR